MPSCHGKRLLLLSGIVLCLALPRHGYAEDKYLYVMGGGGDPPGAGTLFDGEVGDLGGFATGAGWQTTLSFDGGHSKTERIAAEAFPHAENIGPFDGAHFKQMVDDMKAKLSSGAIAPGSELLVVIDTHGAEKFDPNEVTHDVATTGTASDLQNLAGSQTTSLDALQDVVSLANQKGVKLAVVDDSCFSGNTQALANSQTCVISATGTRQFAYGPAGGFGGFFSSSTFVQKFDRSLKTGKNLEDLFVDARTPDGDPDFPMISTPTGQEIDSKLYALVSPYLSYDSSDGERFSDQYSFSPEAFASDRCSAARNFSDLMQLLDGLSSTVAQNGETLETADLKKALQKYRDYQVRFETAVQGTQIAGQEFEKLLASDHPDQQSLFANEDGVTSLYANYDESIAMYQRLYDQASPGYAMDLWEKTLDSVQQKKAITEDIRSKLSPAARESLSVYDKAVTDAYHKTNALASKVSNALKSVYGTLYRAQSKGAAQSNACRDFVL